MANPRNLDVSPGTRKAQIQGITFTVAVNNELVLEQNVFVSPPFREANDHQLLLQKDFPSAGLAYNDSIRRAEHDLMVFMHQDLYLPKRWDERLLGIIARLEKTDSNWGVIGVYGITPRGTPAGYVYSNGLNRMLGSAGEPAVVRSLDEVLLIVRKSRGLTFDPTLPHFHLYGTDICLQAAERGLKSYAISNLCFHNSNTVKRLDGNFWTCVRYMRRKWSHRLPVRAPCITLESSGWLYLKNRIRSGLWFFRRNMGDSIRSRVENPMEFFHQVILPQERQAARGGLR
jgi:hypothetical protein